jgi:single-stranded-DNA-specific exonuclease
LPALLHVQLADIPEGLAGLLASRLADRFRRPVLVTIDADPAAPLVKGSGRSWAGYPLLKLAEPYADCCERFGGHDQAFGFSIAREHVAGFVGSVCAAVAGYPGDQPVVDNVDLELETKDLDAQLFEYLERCAPFGQANRKPLFRLRGFNPEQFVPFGKEQNHGKYTVAQGAVEIIGWKWRRRWAVCFNRQRNPIWLFRWSGRFFREWSVTVPLSNAF